PLHLPGPRSFPHLPALDSYWELFHRLVEGFGAPAQAVEQLPVSAAAAGLQVVRMDGSFIVDDPVRGSRFTPGRWRRPGNAPPRRAWRPGTRSTGWSATCGPPGTAATSGGTGALFLRLTTRQSGGGASRAGSENGEMPPPPRP